MAMRLDGKIELVAGAFSSNPQKSKLSGEDLLLDPKRVYADYRTMATEESRLPAGERIDFVSVVTPNRTHVPVAERFLETGFNVVCDKPLAFDLEEARALREVVRKTAK
ncbi:MAG TPA: Gfo/Idh/MocA family oxidoreductase, partial [Chthoniobacterales bacterium]|nr:Gfo/Idh/MocA family oxidoreductase [Chthoniobacterales bacterium]